MYTPSMLTKLTIDELIGASLDAPIMVYPEQVHHTINDILSRGPIATGYIVNTDYYVPRMDNGRLWAIDAMANVLRNISPRLYAELIQRYPLAGYLSTGHGHGRYLLDMGYGYNDDITRASEQSEQLIAHLVIVLDTLLAALAPDGYCWRVRSKLDGNYSGYYRPRELWQVRADHYLDLAPESEPITGERAYIAPRDNDYSVTLLTLAETLARIAPRELGKLIYQEPILRAYANNENVRLAIPERDEYQRIAGSAPYLTSICAARMVEAIDVSTPPELELYAADNGAIVWRTVASYAIDVYAPDDARHNWIALSDSALRAIQSSIDIDIPVNEDTRLFFGGNNVPKWTKRVARHLRARGATYTQEQLSIASNLAQRYVMDNLSDAEFDADATQYLDWSPGDYGDDCSCFWTFNSHHREAIDNACGAGALTFFADDRPYGRVLAIAMDTREHGIDCAPALLLTNAYDKDDTITVARVANWLTNALNNAETRGALSTRLRRALGWDAPTQVQFIRGDNYNYDTDIYCNGDAYLILDAQLDPDAIRARRYLSPDDYACYCAACNEHIHEDDAYYSALADAHYCESCYTDRYAHCDDCNIEMRADDALDCDNHTYCESCASKHDYHPCDDCGDYTHLDDLVSADGDNELYCDYCARKHLSVCELCGDYHANEDGVTHTLRLSHTNLSAFVCDGCLPNVTVIDIDNITSALLQRASDTMRLQLHTDIYMRLLDGNHRDPDRIDVESLQLLAPTSSAQHNDRYISPNYYNGARAHVERALDNLCKLIPSLDYSQAYNAASDAIQRAQSAYNTGELAHAYHSLFVALEWTRVAWYSQLHTPTSDAVDHHASQLFLTLYRAG